MSNKDAINAIKKFNSKISLARRIKSEKELKASDKDGKYYPSVYINEVKLPLKGKDIGKKLNAVVELELTSISKNELKGKSEYNYSFDVRSIKFRSD